MVRKTIVLFYLFYNKFSLVENVGGYQIFLGKWVDEYSHAHLVFGINAHHKVYCTIIQ